MADPTPVTAAVGNGGLTPSVLSTVEEWLAFNASIRERLGGGAVCPLRRGVASSEAEMIFPLEGRFATLERGGDEGRSRGSRWEPSSEAEIAPRVRGGYERAACWASFKSFPFF